MNAALLALAALAYFAPEVLAFFGLGSKSALEFMAYGWEAAALWAFAFVTLQHFAARCVAAWGIFEAAQRPICRMAFPLDKRPELPEGKNLCDVAFDLPMSLLSVVFALFLSALVQEVQRASNRT